MKFSYYMTNWIQRIEKYYYYSNFAFNVGATVLYDINLPRIQVNTPITNSLNCGGTPFHFNIVFLFVFLLSSYHQQFGKKLQTEVWILANSIQLALEEQLRFWLKKKLFIFL